MTNKTKNIAELANQKDIKNKAVRAISIMGAVAIIGLTTFTFFYNRKEEKLNQAFQNMPAYIQLKADDDAQRTGIDAPYIRQRQTLDSTYQLKEKELKQMFVNSQNQ